MSTTYSYTIPTVDGTQVKYYTATSNSTNPGVLTANGTGFSFVTPTNSTGVYVLAYNASNSQMVFVNKESSESGDAPPVGDAKGALYLKSTTGDTSWEAFNTGILVANSNTSTVTSISTPSTEGNFVIHYDSSGGYSFTTYTAVNIHFPSGILVGKNSNTPASITASETGNYIIKYDGADYSLVENPSPTYGKGILVGDGTSTLKYMTGQEDDFSSTQSNYYIIKATTTNTHTAPSSYSLSVVPLNGLLYTNSEGINSIEIPKIAGNYALNINDGNEISMNSIPVPSSSGMIMYNAYTSTYKYIEPDSGYFYIRGTTDSNADFFPFGLTNAYSGNDAGILYVSDGANYKQNVMTFTKLKDDDVSSACYTIKANYVNANAVTLESQIINPGIMYGTSDHNVKYASAQGELNADDQYVIKYNIDDQSLFLSSFTATATVSVPTSGILVGGANNVIGKIAPLTNVNDTFVINFASGTTGVDDGTYSLKSLNTLLPTITTSFGSPFSFNLARLQQSATVFVTLTNTNYFCSTQVSIPTYALKTNLVQTRVDVEGIYRVNFDATKTTLKVDTNFSSSLAFPNQNMVDLTFVLAFNDNYVYAGADKFNDNSLAKIGEWTGVYETWDDSGYDFKVNTTKNHTSFIITGNNNAGSTTIATTSNISAIPITNSPPFEYRYFKTSLYFTAGNLTNFDAVNSDTPKLYIFYGYTIDRVPSLADGVSIANVNITVYSSAIPSLPVP